MDLLIQISHLIETVYLTEIYKTRKNKHTKQAEVIYKKVSDIYKEQVLKSNLGNLYLQGYGYKSLVKMLNNSRITYSVLKRIIKDLGIEQRKGQNIVTDKLKQIRSENARKNNYFTDWPIHSPELCENNKRFVGGYYYNKSKQKNVYLRSSWEYAYAKYLDTNLFDWDVEVKQFQIDENTRYLPDFFIFKNTKLIKIVEIKSLYNRDANKRLEKYYSFCKAYPEIDTQLFVNLNDLLELLGGMSYRKLIKEWKSIKKNKKE